MAMDEKLAEVERMGSPVSLDANDSPEEHVDIEKAMSSTQDKDIVSTTAQTVDPDIVDWDGPDDKENPLNWPARRKWMNIGLLSIITLLT